MLADDRKRAMPCMRDNMDEAGPSKAGGDGSDGTKGVERRFFFRALTSDAISIAGTVAGAQRAIRDASAAAADSVLRDLGPATLRATPDALVGSSGQTPPEVFAEGLDDTGRDGGLLRPFRVDAGVLVLLDQRGLPHRVDEYRCNEASDVARAIREQVVCGFGVLGQVVAYGVALASERALDASHRPLRENFYADVNTLRNARPTNATVTHALDRMVGRFEACRAESDRAGVAAAMWEEADAVADEARDATLRMASLGMHLLPWFENRPTRILTHAASGPLTEGGVGTALGVALSAHDAGRPVHVYVTESRPGLEGARLTAWELGKADVAHSLLADTSIGWLLSSERVDAVLVGAEQIAANGDTANTVGTYPLAVIAARHAVPFFVVAPSAVMDLGLVDGSAIVTRMREGDDAAIAGRRITPASTSAANPRCDVTPAGLISAFVTEQGVLEPPYGIAIAQAAVGSPG